MKIAVTQKKHVILKMKQDIIKLLTDENNVAYCKTKS